MIGLPHRTNETLAKAMAAGCREVGYAECVKI